jgi:hypothetical protein
MNRWSRCCVVCLFVAAPALGAENTFDGTYTGKRVLTKGIDQTCPTEDDVSVIIHGESLTFSNSKLRGYVVGFEPHPDGSFSETSTGIEGTIVLIEGRIVGDVIDADVTTSACKHHWHLKRGKAG